MTIQIGINQEALKAKLSKAVNAERDRRIAAGFSFQGNTFDADPDSIANITGAGASAGIAVMQGAAVDNLRWADPDTDFTWLSKNNTAVTMDAPTCFLFSQAAMKHKKAHIFAARAIKDAETTPEDVTLDSLWPVMPS